MNLTASQGGAVFIGESPRAISLSGNSFESCFAEVGGAVSHQSIFVSFSASSFNNNQASLYGDDLAAFPVRLELRNFQDLPLLYTDSRIELTPSEEANFSSVRSGSSVSSFFVAAVDQYGAVVSSLSGAALSFQSESTPGSVFQARASTASGEDILSEWGVFNASEAQLSAEPGSSANFSLSAPRDINPQLTGGRFNPNLTISVTFRGCLSGEEFTDDGRCVLCGAGTFSLEAPSRVQSC